MAGFGQAWQLKPNAGSGRHFGLVDSGERAAAAICAAQRTVDYGKAGVQEATQ